MARSKLETSGWRQGSVFFYNDFPRIRDYFEGINEDDLFIVLPYSCAVVNDNFESKEPSTEVLRATKAADKNKALMWGRNPREIQLQVNGSEEQQPGYVNANIHDRFVIPHSLLTSFEPNRACVLSENTVKLLRYWIAQRYMRNALPGKFNERAAQVLKAMGAKLSKADFVDGIEGVYLKIDPLNEEPALGDPYEVDLIIIATERGRQLYKTELENFLASEADKLSRCDGIELNRSDIESASVITLAEYMELIRVDDYDFVSLRDNVPPPP